MKELVRTNNPAQLAWFKTLLGQYGIQTFVLDSYMSVLEGSTNAIPRRLMVIDDHYAAACRAMIDAGEGAYLVC